MEREIAFVPYFPLGSAFSGGPKQLARDPVIAGVAERRGATASQVALAWLLARYERMLLIPRNELGGSTSRRTWPQRTSNSLSKTVSAHNSISVPSVKKRRSILTLPLSMLLIGITHQIGITCFADRRKHSQEVFQLSSS